ncbi:MAG: Fur family transcriptional regulator [Acidimicrobiia bacterium]
MKDLEIDQVIRDHLALRGIRYTGGRKAVVRALQIASGPQSAAELHRRLRPRVPLSSLYRALATLDEAGLVSLHHGPGKIARYELAEWISGHHHHLVCLQCGAMGDIELDPKAESMLDGLVEVLGQRSGYSVSGHSLEVEGLCRSCR